jgi:hypothetical protein
MFAGDTCRQLLLPLVGHATMESCGRSAWRLPPLPVAASLTRMEILAGALPLQTHALEELA